MMHGLHKFLLLHVLACLELTVPGSAIIRGEEAPENSMLYMASVQEYRRHICGGFLVGKNFVVTAEQCDVNVRKADVVFGHDLKLVENQRKYIVEKCKHPRSKEKGWNDIMLLKLGGEDRPNIKVKPIPLPDLNITENEKCCVAGWGSTKTSGKYVEDLRVVDVSVINCKKQLPADAICTGKGFCKGDYGGPLVCNGIAVGVAYFNKNVDCNYPGVSVYTDIKKFLPWINEVLKKNDCKM
ncbi:granzyme B-like [Sebastes umbrosus]|uniref:granzyme B-like n=1 Tax=Sebastes umbrosus TaxID=72105 RepID=UPI00189E1146|nr:granzyme B-like [Sebastes umbrosus]